jgi:hypothetical protein
MSAEDWGTLLTLFSLAVAQDGSPRTIFSSRIDGLLLPVCEPPQNLR